MDVIEGFALRVFVTGYNCSGKTFAAKMLAREFEIPLTSLDSLYFTDELTELKRDEAERDRLLQQQAGLSSWVIEGRFLSWTEVARERADLIIYMCPLRVRMLWRLVLRFFRQRPREPIRNLFEYSLSILNHKRNWYPMFESATSNMESKVRRVKSSEEAVRVVREGLEREASAEV
jgi:adenylate kinase family enzyme